MYKILTPALAAAAVLVLAPAHAATSSEQISLCSAALEEQGVAPADAFKKKFSFIKGASLKTVGFKLTPVNGGDEKIAECRIKGDTVVSAEIL